MTALQLAADTGTAPTSLEEFVPDPILDGANGGIPWVVHVSESYTGPATIPNGATFRNLVPDGANSSMVVPGVSPTIAGGGIDFSTVDLPSTYLTIPPSVAAAIAAGNQRYLLLFYFRAPIEADWNANAGQGGTLVNWGTTGTWNNDVDIVGMGLRTNAGIRQAIAARQNGVNTSNGNLAPTGILPSIYGAVHQMAFWRSDIEEAFSVRTPAGRFTSVNGAGIGVNNPNAIAGLTGKIGIASGWGPTLDGQELLARRFRFYRGAIEILSVSGRNPLTVADADYQREITNRPGAFS